LGFKKKSVFFWKILKIFLTFFLCWLTDYLARTKIFTRRNPTINQIVIFYMDDTEDNRVSQDYDVITAPDGGFVHGESLYIQNYI